MPVRMDKGWARALDAWTKVGRALGPGLCNMHTRTQPPHTRTHMCGARFSFCESLPFSLLPRPVLTSQPKEYKRMGDPARPWKARDGRWYQIVGASVAGVAGHAALYRARDATLQKMADNLGRSPRKGEGVPSRTHANPRGRRQGTRSGTLCLQTVIFCMDSSKRNDGVEIRLPSPRPLD